MRTNRFIFFLPALFFFVISYGQSVIHQDKWDLGLLDTARDEVCLTDEEKDIVLVMNMVRTDPAKFSEVYLIPMRPLFEKKLLKYPGEISIVTSEGVSALEECIKVLFDSKPVGILYPKKGLSKAAKEHAQDIGKHGMMSHKGTDKSSMSDRVERYGTWDISIAENIEAGNNDALRIVVNLLIDDDVKSRGHRRNIMNPEFNFVGVGMAIHTEYRYTSVMDFAGGYTDKD